MRAASRNLRSRRQASFQQVQVVGCISLAPDAFCFLSRSQIPAIVVEGQTSISNMCGCSICSAEHPALVCSPAVAQERVSRRAALLDKIMFENYFNV